MRKRWVLPALLLGLLLLAACGADGEGPDWDENILVYANLNPQGVDRWAVRRFNSTHKDVQIEVRNYTDGGERNGKHGAELLLTEIMAGKVPDIIDLGSDWGGAGQLPYRQMALKGYLEDLWPYIKNDPDLGREKVLEAPLRAAEVHGGLYMVFEDVTVNTLVGSADVVGDRTSWSLEELLDIYAAMPENSTVLPYVYCKSDVFYYMLGMSLESYVNWETGECSFDGEKFRNILSFINENSPMAAELDAASEELNEEIAKRQQSGRELVMLQLITDPSCVRLLDVQCGGQAAFIGYPVEDGSVGSSFRLSNRKLAMSSVCRNKEAAWDFIRQILLPKYSSPSYSGDPPRAIHINQADYIHLKALTGTEREAEVFYHGPIVRLPQATSEDYQRFDDFFNSIDKIDMCDSSIYEIVREQAEAYFTGDKSLDETVDLIQRRVSLYVNETR